MGIDVNFVKQDISAEELEKEFKWNRRCRRYYCGFKTGSQCVEYCL
jgi:hypothetical protein